MIDDDEGAAVGVQLAHQLDDLVAQERIHAGERLIEEQDLGVQHQRAAEFQQLLLAAGQVLRLQRLQRGEAEEFEMPPRGAGRRGLVGMRPREARHQHVLQHGHAAEQLRDLEGAADAQGGEFTWRVTIGARAAQKDVAAGGCQMAGEHVDRGGLAGTVRADQADEFALLHGKVQAAHRDDAAEALGEVAGFDERGTLLLL